MRFLFCVLEVISHFYIKYLQQEERPPCYLYSVSGWPDMKLYNFDCLPSTGENWAGNQPSLLLGHSHFFIFLF